MQLWSISRDCNYRTITRKAGCIPKCQAQIPADGWESHLGAADEVESSTWHDQPKEFGSSFFGGSVDFLKVFFFFFFKHQQKITKTSFLLFFLLHWTLRVLSTKEKNPGVYSMYPKICTSYHLLDESSTSPCRLWWWIPPYPAIFFFGFSFFQLKDPKMVAHKMAECWHKNPKVMLPQIWMLYQIWFHLRIRNKNTHLTYPQISF